MLHRVTRRATGVILLAVGTAAGCSSSSPTSPGPTQNRMDLMPGGTYTMLITSALDLMQPCRVDPSRSPFFLSLTQVTISTDGDTWIGRATDAADGDIELRIRHVRDEAVIGGRVVMVRVEGTVRGSLQAPRALFSNERIAFGATTDTRVEGSLTEGATSIGTVRGEIVHTNPAGSVSCPTAAWRMSRTGPSF